MSFFRRQTKGSNGADSHDARQGNSSSTATSATYTTTNNQHEDRTSEPVAPAQTDREDHDPTSILHREYAHKRRELLEIVHDLRALGSEKELDVPQIAVIGKQSAGKSSLVEAVTGIKVPRDAETCTRCPTECTITADSQEWSCTVTIRGSSQEFSGIIHSKDQVELWIRRAQAAVLCPHISTDTFKTKNREELKDIADSSVDSNVLKFSKKAIEIRISDPEGSDLMFVDLPGLIQSGEDDNVINMVEEMASESISRPSTIILVIVPAEDDLDNQGAMKLAKTADESGERTIGIVTKADRVSVSATGRQKAWKDLFEGRATRHKLSLGYYAVSLPDDKQRADNITRREAQQQASRVFDTVAPWMDLRATCPGRLGVQALVHDISPLLLKMLVDAIPRLKATVDQLLDSCLQEFRRLPPQRTRNTASELVQLISAFCESVIATAKGTSEDKSFVHRSREAYNSLKFSIRATAPDFRPFEYPAQFCKPGDPSSVQENSVQVVQSPRAASPPSSETRPGSPVIEISVPASPIEVHHEVEGIVLGLMDVRQVIKEETSWELPHNIPYSAKTRLIGQFVRRWSDPSQRCFLRMQRVLDEYVFDKLIPLHFAQYSALQGFVRERLLSKMKEYIRHSETSVQDVLKREETPYFTQNGHYFETSRDLWMGHYKAIRACRNDYRLNRHVAYEYNMPGLPSRPKTPEYTALNALRALRPFRNISFGDLHRLLPPDEFADELNVMADVRGYFQVAYKRLIDEIPRTIHRDFVEGFAHSLQTYLLDALDLGGDNASKRIQMLLEEDPRIRDDRVRLEERRKRLESIKARLDSFRI
ncbi:P-loop containing nucleoside triphosphate hydrolase protein [Dichomitus squalens]|nr:P-loop containing nucleoside triphosphate hydrolase protein [Dichomitus squalens]